MPDNLAMLERLLRLEDIVRELKARDRPATAFAICYLSAVGTSVNNTQFAPALTSGWQYPASVFTNGTNYFVTPYAGRYTFTAWLSFNANGAGQRRAYFMIAGSVYARDIRAPSSTTDVTDMTVAGEWGVGAGVAIEFFGYQTSGANLNYSNCIVAWEYQGPVG